MNESTATLNSTVEGLAKSSLRLELLTGALLLATGILVIFTAEAHFFALFTAQGFGFQQALAWTTLGTLTSAGVYAVAVYILLRRYRRRGSMMQSAPKERRA